MPEWNGRLIPAMNSSTIKPDDPKRDLKIAKLINDPVYVFQRKLNGERLIVYKHMKSELMVDDNIEYSYERLAYGRNSSKYGPPMMKTGLVQHILDELNALVVGDILLDGEVLFVPDQELLTPEEIKSMAFVEDFWQCRDIMAHHVNQSGGVAQQEAIGRLHYFVFDVLAYKGLETANYAYGKRLELLEERITPYFESAKYIHVVPVEREADKKKALLEYCISIGLEGVIAKNLRMVYMEGKRPANAWVKIKKSDPSDGIIIGYSHPEQYTEVIRHGKKVVGPNGKVMVAESRFFANEWVGAVWLGQFIEDSRITPRQRQMWKEVLSFDGPFLTHLDIQGPAGHTLMPVAKVSGMKDGQRADISENLAKYLGQVVAFKYFEKTPDSYFHPSFVKFRNDKAPHECVWE